MPAEFLYRIEPTRPEMVSAGPTPYEAAAVEAHFAYLQRLAREGVVELAGRTTRDDEAFGIVLLRAADGAEARAVVERDPAVERGVMRGALHPFRTAVRAPSGDAERVRDALLAAALAAHEDAGLRGLCAEGRWECAVDALRRVDLRAAAADGAGGAGDGG